MKKQIQKRGGFTLIELLIIMAILGIIASILLPRYPAIIEKAREKAAIAEAASVALAVDAYRVDHGEYLDFAHKNELTLGGGMKDRITDLDEAGFTYTASSGWIATRDKDTLKITVTKT